ncbi:MAG TPA: hypothetical protein VF045_06275 [Acidimicrobiales bacterium]
MSGRRTAVTWLVAGAAAVAGIAIVGAILVRANDGGAPSPSSSGPRPVTAAEADRLAVMRFLLHQGRGVHFRTHVSTAGNVVSVAGLLDFHGPVGYGQVSSAGSSFTLQWTKRSLVAWPAAETISEPPPDLPAGSPTARPLAPAQSAVDTVLALLLELGLDRPDNAQLIRANGARWVRSDTIAGTRVDVLQGPAATADSAASGGPLTYWVDATGRLLRVEAYLGGGGRPTAVDLDAGSFTPFPRAADLPA